MIKLTELEKRILNHMFEKAYDVEPDEIEIWFENELDNITEKQLDNDDFIDKWSNSCEKRYFGILDSLNKKIFNKEE